MISNEERQSLVAAAKKLQGRDLTTTETQKLIDTFEKSAALTRFEKAKEALAAATDLSESQIQQKCASSDDTERVVNDLREVLNRPKK